jgi:CYTH domain-containing protein
MAKEKERKFKLKYMPGDGLLKSVNIKQGYLMFEGKKHLRVRIFDDTHGFICFKTIVNDQEKNEYEYSIPLEDAMELYNSTNIKLEKNRIPTQDDYGNNVDIDIYPDGLQVVEIEFDEFPHVLPDYFGEEVTGQKEYSNIYIAKQNG